MINAKLVTFDDYETLRKRVEALEAQLLKSFSKVQEKSNKEYLSVKEFIDQIGVSRSTFENMRKETELGKFRLHIIKRGNRIYVPVKELQRYFSHI